MKQLKITLGVLIIVTIIAAFISNNVGVYTSSVLLMLAVIKFIGVSFYFMELKKAHPFWKAIIIVFLLIFSASIIIIL